MIPFLLGYIAPIYALPSGSFSPLRWNENAPRHRQRTTNKKSDFIVPNPRPIADALGLAWPFAAPNSAASEPAIDLAGTDQGLPHGSALGGRLAEDIKTFTPDHRNVTCKTPNRLATNGYRRVAPESKLENIAQNRWETGGLL